MNKLLKRGLLLLALLFVLTGCNLTVDETNSLTYEDSIVGTSSTNYGGEITFTETLYDKDGWCEGSIEKIVNGRYNENITPTTEGDYGYLVVKFNGGAGTGKYGVVRWRSLKNVNDVITFEYSEGSNYKDQQNPGTYFNSVEEAEAGMTIASGHFGQDAGKFTKCTKK